MKKKIIYIIFGLFVLAIVGYFIYKFYISKIDVLSHVPKDVSFCITINNKKISEEITYLDLLKRDTLVKTAKSGIIVQTQKIIDVSGFNPLGNFVIFGKNNYYSIAWIGITKKTFFNYLKKKNQKIIKSKNYEYTILKNNYFLCFDWPLILLSNKMPDVQNGFFSNNSDKLSTEELKDETNKKSTIYGFIKPDSNLFTLLKILPIKEKAFLSINISEDETIISLIQKNYKPNGNNFIPELNKKCIMKLSCPWVFSNIDSFKILPSEIKNSFQNMLAKPVNHVNLEVLDTITSNEQVITYDMDAEFKLTQKINVRQKVYPGLYLELFKNKTDSVNAVIKSDFFKFNLYETPNSYILKSGEKTFKTLPYCYLYANVELLQYDPFWKSYCISTIKKIIITTTAHKKGSEIKTRITY